jgi:hypothetical protein
VGGTPNRVAVVLLTVAVAMVVTGAEAGAAKQPPRPVVLTADQLNAGTLTLSDMPAGTQALATGSATLSATGGPCNGPDALTLAEKAGKVAEGHSVLNNDAGAFNFFVNTVLSFPSVSAAKHYLQLVKASIKACTTGWSTHSSPDPADPPNQLTIKLLPFTKLADERFADQVVDTTLSDTTDSVVLRLGNHVSLVSLTGGSANLGTGSAPELRTYAQKALNHLAAALRQATTK